MLWQEFARQERIVACVEQKRRHVNLFKQWLAARSCPVIDGVDEAMHWRRYFNGYSDRVEMWSHFFIFTGHFIMMMAWLYWFDQGYPGVAETLRILKG